MSHTAGRVPWSRRALAALGLILLLPTGCGGPPAPETVETADHWTVSAMERDGVYTDFSYTVLGGAGTVLLEDAAPERPALALLGDDVVQIRVDCGGPGWRARFVRLSDGAVSDWYDYPVAASGEHVAWLDWPEDDGPPVLAVDDLRSNTTLREYALPFSGTAAAPDALIPYAALSSYDLTVVFLNGDEVPETRTLPLYGLDWADNPIDRFYQTYRVDWASTYEFRVFALADKTVWQAEAEHAYDLLEARGNFGFDAAAAETREAFFAYAERQAKLEAYYTTSNAFGDDGPSDALAGGSGLPGFQSANAADLYRTQALKLYGLLETDCGFAATDEAFVFDPDTYLTKLREDCGLTVVER